MNQETIKMCPKCGKPRHVSESGRVDPLCIDHMRDHWRNKRRPSDSGIARTPAPRKISTTCNVEGCEEPRAVSKSGRQYATCEHHRREYQREKAAARRGGSTSPKYSDAQIKAGFGSPDARVSGKKVLLLVIDETADEMLFIEGRVTLACPTHRQQLLPGGFDLLIERHAEQGYQIIRGNQ